MNDFDSIVGNLHNQELDDVNAMFDTLQNLGVSEETLLIVSAINGYTTSTMQDILYAATGYRAFHQIP